MAEKGLDSSLVEERMRNRSRSKSLAEIKKKKGSEGMMDEDEEDGSKARNRIR